MKLLTFLHTFVSLRHAMQRMLGIRSQTSQGSGGLISLKLPDREVIVSMSHVSIEPEQIDRAVNDPQVKASSCVRVTYSDLCFLVFL